MQPLTTRVKRLFLTSFRKKRLIFACKLRCDVPFGRLQECPQLPMTAARDQLHPTILKTRNRFVLNRARWFESHHLRQQKAPAQAGAFFAAKMVRMRTGRRPADRALLLYSITHPIVKCVGFVGLHGEPDKSAFGNIFHFSTRRHEKDRTLPALPEASYENQSKFAIQNLFQCF